LAPLSQPEAIEECADKMMNALQTIQHLYVPYKERSYAARAPKSKSLEMIRTEGEVKENLKALKQAVQEFSTNSVGHFDDPGTVDAIAQNLASAWEDPEKS
jgi:hypothetical protein